METYETTIIVNMADLELISIIFKDRIDYPSNRIFDQADKAKDRIARKLGYKDYKEYSK